MSAFEELGLQSNLCQLLEENSIDLPTAIQQESIPLILGGGDLCACAETGTGKTLSFIVSSLQIVDEILRNIDCYSSKRKNTKREDGEIKKNEIEEERNKNEKGGNIILTSNANSPILINGYECIYKNPSGNNFTSQYMEEVTANCEIQNGKYAFEVEILSNSFVNVGFCPLVRETSKYNYTYCSNGGKFNNNRITPYADTFGANDIITCMINKNEHLISFKKNGQFLNVAFKTFYKYNDIPFVPYISGKFFHIRFHFSNLKYVDNKYGYEECSKLTNISMRNGEDSSIVKTKQFNSMSKEYDQKIHLSDDKKLLCIVLCPTKDLAMQTYKNYLIYVECFSGSDITIGTAIGGEMTKKEVYRNCNILVCTTYKLMELFRKKTIEVSHLKLLILDEADELIQNDEQSIFQIKEFCMQQSNHVQTLFFSATLQDKHVKNCIGKITNSPIFVDLKYGKHYIPSHIYVCIYYVDSTNTNIIYDNKDKEISNIINNELLNSMSMNQLYEFTDKVHLLNVREEKERLSLQIKINKLKKLIHLINAFNMENGIIFCRTNLDCDNVYKFLNHVGDGKCYKGTVETMKENKYSCVVLKGKMSLEQRQSNLEAFQKGEVRFLICTDVASRGINIQNLRHLIIFTLTDNINTFFHKIGRVGRDGKNSLCIVLSADKVEEKVWFHTCPSKGVNCFNRNLKEEKGCTTFINESNYIKSINEVLECPMHVLDPKYYYAENIVDPLNYFKNNPDKNKSRRNKNQGTKTIFSEQSYKNVLFDFNSSIRNIRKMQAVLHKNYYNILHHCV